MQVSVFPHSCHHFELSVLLLLAILLVWNDIQRGSNEHPLKSDDIEYEYICIWVWQSFWNHFQMGVILKDHEKKMTMKSNTIIHAYHASFSFLYFRLSILFVGVYILYAKNFSGQARTFSLPFSPLYHSPQRLHIKWKIKHRNELNSFQRFCLTKSSVSENNFTYAGMDS